MTNLSLTLREAAQMYPDRPAVRLDSTALTYAQLDDLSARAAGWLRERGLRPGDPVGIMLPNVPHFPVFYYGVLRAGGAIVPMNPLLKAREVAHYLGDSGASLVLAWETAAGEAAGDPVYLGNHRHPEGRGADARQHAEERLRDRHGAARPRP